MKTTLTSALLIGALTTFSQEKGNVAYDAANNAYEGNYAYRNYNYGNYNYGNYPKSGNGNGNLYLPNDSVYMMGARVMINLQPDAYQAAFGVTQEGATVAECNKLINERIEKFKTSLRGAGVKDEDIFVDLIAQTRIYDYKIAGKTANEVKAGFELKKNVIIKFTDHDLAEKMMIMAAEQEIFDIIKVDYIITDIEKVQNQLRQAALEVIDGKKKFLLSNSSLALADKGLIHYENFNTLYPSDAYKQYTAAEGSYVTPSYYNSNSWVKEQRKSKTFYFDKVNPSSFDKVINPLMVKIPVQMTLDIAYKFYIGKPEKKTRKA